MGKTSPLSFSVFAALKDSLTIGAALDGELVAFDETGAPSFNALENAGPNANVVFFAFDVLVSEGKDVRNLPLRARKTILRLVLDQSDRIQLAEYFPGPLAKFTKAVREIGSERVVAKRLDVPYEPGRRSGSWSKMRINIGQEFVIGGFTTGSNGVAC